MIKNQDGLNGIRIFFFLVTKSSFFFFFFFFFFFIVHWNIVAWECTQWSNKGNCSKKCQVKAKLRDQESTRRTKTLCWFLWLLLPLVWTVFECPFFILVSQSHSCKVENSNPDILFFNIHKERMFNWSAYSFYIKINTRATQAW